MAAPLPALPAASGRLAPPRTTAEVLEHYAASCEVGFEIAVPGQAVRIQSCALSSLSLHDCMELDDAALVRLLPTAPRDERGYMLAQRRQGSVLFVLTLREPTPVPLPCAPGESLLVAMLDLSHHPSCTSGRCALVTGFKCHFIGLCLDAVSMWSSSSSSSSSSTLPPVTFQVAAATDSAHQRSLWVEATRGIMNELIVTRLVVRSEWGFLFDVRYYGGA